MKYINIFFIIFVSLFSCSLSALSYENVEDLKNIAREFIINSVPLETDETLEVNINLSDLPAQLAKCSKKITAKFPNEFSREKINSVELSCNDAPSWHIFVPADVQIFTKVVVAKHPISANEIISESDVDYAKANISRLYSGYFNDKTQIKGYVAAQMINSGAVITKKNTRRQQLVHKNQVIDLIARKNSIVVTMKGIAKSDGCLNESIIAYNPSSKKTMEAIVIGFNKAEVIS
ncbi:flagellar basal body P-ring formation chaperone FlgA [Aquicella lusitana]|uniref:Flagella basal body P-ring formation protein FlgA n=1 Tax=Aquicella lusitana TaxID=254246 RepID=A0A370GDD1_9COXI|nr:flagellar basal body P-ring formation chaperone FlgA [Aquicella lusitana]RDI39973.1 flagella basal body P-ring formation protein FlgA [Aquicella lusitana]VVC74576.1 hypothetical protein AQULUS_23420 [Aquicella lusitana]